MDFKLTRTDYLSVGIFGTMQSTDGASASIYAMLEHAYPNIPDSTSAGTTYSPKVSPGTYTCIKGTHALSNGQSFEAFMLENVEEHTGILIHPGNLEHDSEGCLLIGKERQGNAVIHSAIAFSEFMAIQKDVNSFVLVIA